MAERSKAIIIIIIILVTNRNNNTIEWRKKRSETDKYCRINNHNNKE